MPSRPSQIEIIVVDQNADDRLVELLQGHEWPFPIMHLTTPGKTGASRARNAGTPHAKGSYIVFADDDCWYPPGLFADVESFFRTTGVDIVSGRAANESGRSINSRFETTIQQVERHNVWTTSIEWMLFFRREILSELGGFDEQLGPGANSPWQAAEGQDIVLHALAKGYSSAYNPDLIGHHAELDIVTPDARQLAKSRAYARAMGVVLARHHYGLASIVYWTIRPLLAASLHAGTGNIWRARYYLSVAQGRLEGWLPRHSSKPRLVSRARVE